MFCIRLSTLVQRLVPSLALLLLLVGGCGQSAGDGTGDTGIDCTAGEQGCACAAGNECLATNDEGEALVCSNEICVVAPSCELGDTGCSCTDAGACIDSSDECRSDNTCGPRTSCTGELGCECDSGACEDGLTCSDNLCTSPTALLVELSGGDARACDLRVVLADGRFADVTFPAGVRGRSSLRNEVAGVSLIRTEDSSLSGIVAGLVLDGDVEASAADVSELTVTCYDRLGAADGDVSATLE